MDRGLLRRIKRHVWAAPQIFVAGCGRGVEPLLAEELAELGLDQLRVQPGAVEFGGRFIDLYRVGLESALAERVWWRVLDCRDRGPGHLAGRLAALDWELLLGPGFRLDTAVTGPGLDREARQRLARLVLGSYQDRMGRGAEGPVQRLLLRRSERRWRLGLDSSGERLDRRGYRLDSGRAPLRETLAAAVLRLAGYDPAAPLWDPMCGSGTFLIEAARQARGLAPGLAPGGARRFAFMDWSNFREATWRHLLREVDNQVKEAPPAPIVGLDRHPPALEAAAANAARAGVALDLRPGDFFTLEAPGGPPGLVVLNPPYGRRLRITSQADRYYRRLGARLDRCFPGWRTAVLAPSLPLAEAAGPPGAAAMRLKSGGRSVFVVTGRRPGNIFDSD